MKKEELELFSLQEHATWPQCIADKRLSLKLSMKVIQLHRPNHILVAFQEHSPAGMRVETRDETRQLSKTKVFH